VVAILTGNVLKDQDYTYQYHQGELKTSDGIPIAPNLGNPPVVVPYDLDRITAVLNGLAS
jgi:hypothetical protein